MGIHSYFHLQKGSLWHIPECIASFCIGFMDSHTGLSSYLFVALFFHVGAQRMLLTGTVIMFAKAKVFLDMNHSAEQLGPEVIKKNHAQLS